LTNVSIKHLATNIKKYDSLPMTMYTMLSTLKQDHCVIKFDFFLLL